MTGCHTTKHKGLAKAAEQQVEASAALHKLLCAQISENSKATCMFNTSTAYELRCVSMERPNLRKLESYLYVQHIHSI
eukprot:5289644-Amphidinium_carterae.1